VLVDGDGLGMVGRLKNSG
jgi:hypothetical protein